MGGGERGRIAAETRCGGVRAKWKVKANEPAAVAGDGNMKPGCVQQQSPNTSVLAG